MQEIIVPSNPQKPIDIGSSIPELRKGILQAGTLRCSPTLLPLLDQIKPPPIDFLEKIAVLPIKDLLAREQEELPEFIPLSELLKAVDRNPLIHRCHALTGPYARLQESGYPGRVFRQRNCIYLSEAIEVQDYHYFFRTMQPIFSVEVLETLHGEEPQKILVDAGDLCVVRIINEACIPALSGLTTISLPREKSPGAQKFSEIF